MITMNAPSGIPQGSPVIFPDGSETTVDANLQVAVPVAFVSNMLNAGFTIPVPSTAVASSENAYIRTDVGTKDLLVAAAAARRVMIVVTVTTAFANGDGAQPTLTIGEEGGSATKFAAAAKFTGAAAGATFAFAGTLTSGKKLQAVLVAATGTTSTGAYTIDIIAVQ
jgi:hypothetical protein